MSDIDPDIDITIRQPTQTRERMTGTGPMSTPPNKAIFMPNYNQVYQEGYINKLPVHLYKGGIRYRGGIHSLSDVHRTERANK